MASNQDPESYDSIVKTDTRKSKNISRPTSAGRGYSNSIFRTISNATGLSKQKSRRAYEEAEDDEPSIHPHWI